MTIVSLIYFQIIQRDNCMGDNFIQNFHLGRYIIGYTVGNLVKP